MFLISVCFRPTRSKGKGGRPGVVYYRIAKYGADGPRVERCVNSDIHGADESVLLSERERIVRQIRLIYCIIEHGIDGCVKFDIDDVGSEFRKALAGDVALAGMVERAKCDFALRKDIVSIGREFRSAFTYVRPMAKREIVSSLSDYMFNLIQMLRSENRISQARNINSLQSSLLDFADTDVLEFCNVNADFVRNYAVWLKQKGIVESTQSFYLRTLRLVLNKAHGDGLLDVSADWFKNVNTRIYKPLGSANGILSREVLSKLEDLDLSSDGRLALVRDMFMFGFYCEGMELVDIANLTKENVRNNTLVYRRRRKGLGRSIVLGEKAQIILKRYSRRGLDFLFPLLENSGLISFGAIRNYVSMCLKEIGKSVGFPKLTFSMNISSYKSLVSGVNISEILMKHGSVG